MGKIIAFSGSSSSVSINQHLVHVVAKHITEHEVQILSLIDYPAPVFSSDLKNSEGVPQSIQDLHALMSEADGFLISTPEHNGSMPAVFKNTIDWLSMLGQKVFHEKPTFFMSTSPGPRGGVSALKHLVDIMPFRGAQIVGHYSLPSFGENVIDDAINPERLAEILEPLKALELAVAESTQV